MGTENDLTYAIIGAAIEVHRRLGPGLLESAYSSAIGYELRLRGVRFEKELEVPVRYKGNTLAGAYRVDMLVEDAVVLEFKSVERVLNVHEAQLLTYLRMMGKRVGLLINFNVPVLKDGIHRRILQ